MEDDDRYSEHVRSLAVGHLPRSFWEGIAGGMKRLYGEMFAAVKTDPSILASQKLTFLHQRRHFGAEQVLHSAARDAGVPVSETLIGANGCHYVYAKRGGIGVTQNYAPVIGGRPKPASFRTQLAAANVMATTPQLALGDQPDELLLPPEVNGLLLHTPRGRDFSEEGQALAALGFYIGVPGEAEWLASFTLEEMIAAYPQIDDRREDRATPRRKAGRKTGTEG